MDNRLIDFNINAYGLSNLIGKRYKQETEKLTSDIASNLFLETKPFIKNSARTYDIYHEISPEDTRIEIKTSLLSGTSGVLDGKKFLEPEPGLVILWATKDNDHKIIGFASALQEDLVNGLFSDPYHIAKGWDPFERPSLLAHFKQFPNSKFQPHCHVNCGRLIELGILSYINLDHDTISHDQSPTINKLRLDDRRQKINISSGARANV